MKKKVIALCIGLMSTALLAACGNSEAQTQEPAAETAEAEGTETEDMTAEVAAPEETAEAETETEDASDTTQDSATLGNQETFDSLKQALVYMGGLSVADRDLQFAIYKNNDSGDVVVYLKKQGVLDNGSLETTDATLSDGSEYQKFDLNGREYGYYFNEDLSGYVVDEGNKYDGKELSEKDALKLVEEAVTGYVSEDNTETAEVNDASEDPEGEFEKVKENLAYMGGLYISDPKNDLQMALFKNDGLPIVIITKLGNVWYGEYTTEDAKLDDGTEYTKILINDSEFGYHFNDDMTGIMIDEDGKKYDAKELDESVALDMVKKTITG